MRPTTIILLALVVAMLTLSGIVAWRRPLRREALAPQPLAQRVDVNTADAATLGLLPDIGPALAAGIVADREVRGPFRSVEDLGRVAGIGPKRLEGLRPLVVCTAPADAEGRQR